MATISLLRRDLLGLYAALLSVGEVKAPIQVTYALAKTKRLLQPEYETLQELLKAHQEQARELALACAQQNGAGPKLTEDGQGYVLDPEKRQRYTDGIKALNGELDALLKAPVDVEVHQIGWALLPAELTCAQADGLWPMLTGEPPPPSE